jgi:hypothetical protein
MGDKPRHIVLFAAFPEIAAGHQGTDARSAPDGCGA